MAKNDVFSRLTRLEKSEGMDDLSQCSYSREAHVLAVDDSFVDRKVIERLLQITCCKVTAVDSGRRALQFLGLEEEESSAGLDGLKVDLIITDYCMPGMTGYELLKKIKGSSTFREVPVVIMSSENVLARIDRCLEEGAEDFIVKPVKLSDVKRLKSYMLSEGQILRHDGGFNKRKLQKASSDISLSLTPSSSTSLDHTFSGQSPPSIFSPFSPRSFSSLPPSPTSVDSPTRRFQNQ